MCWTLSMATTSERKICLGVAGLGRAFSVMLPTFIGDPRVTLAAAADTRPEARQRFTADFSARSYPTIEELCADPGVEAIYIATPHQYHARHATLAAQHGKHLLIEKPMALDLDECTAIIDEADRAGVHVVVGHSHSFDAPVQRLRALPNGVMIYQDGLARLDALPLPSVPRVEVIDELYEAVVRDKAPLHNGAWAMATVEVLLAMLRSAREGSEVHLSHQVAVP
jgi:predicted dehydrogenase